MKKSHALWKKSSPGKRTLFTANGKHIDCSVRERRATGEWGHGIILRKLSFFGPIKVFLFSARASIVFPFFLDRFLPFSKLICSTGLEFLASVCQPNPIQSRFSDINFNYFFRKFYSLFLVKCPHETIPSYCRKLIVLSPLFTSLTLSIFTLMRRKFDSVKLKGRKSKFIYTISYLINFPTRIRYIPIKYSCSLQVWIV